MTESRDRLQMRAEQEIPVTPDTQKAAVLAVLARDPDVGYTPKELATEAPIPEDNVYPILKRLREDNLVEKLVDHYLVASENATKVQDIVLTTRQSAVADDISNRNTAPETVDTKDPSDLEAPTGDLNPG